MWFFKTSDFKVKKKMLVKWKNHAGCEKKNCQIRNTLKQWDQSL